MIILLYEIIIIGDYVNNYCFYPYQNDLIYDEINIDYNKIKIINKKKEKFMYKTIIFQKPNSILENTLKNEILFFLNKHNISKKKHILIVGMGSDFYTPDAIGPNTIKHIKVNSYLENLGIKLNVAKISALKPGVLGETGILSENIILSVKNEIKPDFVILIDSFVTNNINYLNHTIELNNYGISPGIGIKGINSFISQKNLHVPLLVIGVTTSILVKFNNENVPYILSCKDIDEYTIKISKVLGNSINKAIDSLK